MIAGAAFVPETPLLVPEVAQGAAPELDDLRAACRTAIKRVAGAAERIVVVGSAAASGTYPARMRGTLAGFGVPLEVCLGSDERGPVELPPSLTIGAWLVRDALGGDTGATGIAVAGPDEALTGLDTGAALVVVGDGSARRSTSAPGYLDERAAPFDAAVAAALASGEPARLHLDADLGAQLLAAGVPAWRAAGAALGAERYDAELLYEDAPYGVGYFVAAWTPRA